jgi:hypothetical protein
MIYLSIATEISFFPILLHSNWVSWFYQLQQITLDKLQQLNLLCFIQNRVSSKLHTNSQSTSFILINFRAEGEACNTLLSNSCNLVLIIDVIRSLKQIGHKINQILSNSNPDLISNFHWIMVDLWSKFPIQKLCQLFKSTSMQNFLFFWGP